MIELKDPRKLPYAGFQICEEVNCKSESSKIWASSESKIVDLCDLHYMEARKK